MFRHDESLHHNPWVYFAKTHSDNADQVERHTRHFGLEPQPHQRNVSEENGCKDDYKPLVS